MWRNNVKSVRSLPVLISAFLVGCTALPIQATEIEEERRPATLAVSAEGTLRLAPDLAILTLAVETAGKSLNEVQRANRTRMQAVTDRLVSLGIDKKHLSTSSFQVTPNYARPPQRSSSEEPTPPRILGYTVVNQLQVEVHEIEAMGRILDAALDAGANRFSGLRWEVEDEHDARFQALEMAGTKAREKAESLAQALDVRLIRLMEVHEEGVHVVPRNQRMAMSLREGVATDGNVPLSPGEIEVKASVRLLYEIAPAAGRSH